MLLKVHQHSLAHICITHSNQLLSVLSYTFCFNYEHSSSFLLVQSKSRFSFHTEDKMHCKQCFRYLRLIYFIFLRALPFLESSEWLYTFLPDPRNSLCLRLSVVCEISEKTTTYLRSPRFKRLGSL